MASDVYKGLTVEFRAKTTGVSSALGQLTRDARKAQTELNQIDRALRMDPGNVEILRQKEKAAAQQAQILRERIAAVTQALSQTERGSDAYDRLQRELAVTGARLNEVEQQARDASAALAAMEAMGSDVASMLSRNQASWERRAASFGAMATSFEKSERAFSSAGRALTHTVTPAVLGVGAASLKAAIDYESAFAGVRKTVDMTEAEFQRLYDATLALSETSPVSATDLMAIEEMGGQLGISNDAMLEFAQVISGLGVATNLTLEDAATEFAQFANITGMSQSDFGRLGSTLVDLGNNAATTEADIMAMAMRIAGAGTSAGMSVTDIMAMSTTLSSLGINAEAGGTAISTIISNIDKQVATNGKNLSTWADTWAAASGRSADEFADAWRSDPVVALEMVIEGMAGMQDEGGNLSVLLQELGVTSIRQTDAFKRMANGGDLFARTLQTARTAWEQDSALQNEVSRRYETTQSKVEILKNKVSNVAATLGGPLADALVGAIDAAEPLIQAASELASGFAAMDEKDRRFVLTIAGMVAALGPALSILGKISKVGGTLMRGLESFSSNRAAAYQTALSNMTSASANATTAVGSATSAVNGFTQAANSANGVTMSGAQAEFQATADRAETARGRASAVEGAARSVDGVTMTAVQGEYDKVGKKADETAERGRGVKSGIEDGVKKADLADAAKTAYAPVATEISAAEDKAKGVGSAMREGASADLSSAAHESYVPVATEVDSAKAKAGEVKGSMVAGVDASADISDAARRSYEPVSAEVDAAKQKAEGVKSSMVAGVQTDLSETAHGSYSGVTAEADSAKAHAANVKDGMAEGVKADLGKAASDTYVPVNSAIDETKKNARSVGESMVSGASADLKPAAGAYADVDSAIDSTKERASGVKGSMESGAKANLGPAAIASYAPVGDAVEGAKSSAASVGPAMVAGASADLSGAAASYDPVKGAAADTETSARGVKSGIESANSASTSTAVQRVADIGDAADGREGARGKVASVGGAIDDVNGKNTNIAKTQVGGIGERAEWATRRVNDVGESIGRVNGRSTERVTGQVGRIGSAALGAASFVGSTLAGALASLGIGVAIMGVMAVVTQLQKAAEEAEALKGASENVKDRLDKINDTEVNPKGMDGFKQSVQDIHDSVVEAVGSYNSWADGVADGIHDIDATEKVLDGYIATIEELGGRADLTRDEQARLTAAVEGFNAITGSSVTTNEVMNDSLEDTSKRLREVADGWVAAARAEAYQDAIKGAVAQQIEFKKQIDGINEQIDATRASYDSLSEERDRAREAFMEEYKDTPSDLMPITTPYDDMNRRLYALSSDMDSLNAELETAQAGYDSASQDVAYFTEQLSESTRAVSGNAGALRDHLGSMAGLDQQFLSNDHTIDEFALAMDAAGLKVEDFANVGVIDMAGVAQVFDGTAASVVGALGNMGISLDAAAAAEGDAAVAAQQAAVALKDYETSAGGTVKVTEGQAAAFGVLGKHIADVSTAMGGLDGSLKSAVLAQTGKSLTQFGLEMERTGGSVEHFKKVYEGLRGIRNPTEDLARNLSEAEYAALAATMSVEQLEAANISLARTTAEMGGNLDDQHETLTRFNDVTAQLYSMCETEADIEFVNQLVEQGPAALGEMENIAAAVNEGDTNLHMLSNTYAAIEDLAASGAVSAEIERQAAAFRILGTAAFGSAYTIDEATGNIIARVGEGADSVLVEFDSATGEVVRILEDGSPEAEAAAAEIAASVESGVDGTAEQVGSEFEEASDAAAGGLREGASDVSAGSELLGDETMSALADLPDEMEARGKVSGWSLADGIKQESGEVGSAAASVADVAVASLDRYSEAYIAGRSIALGLAYGIRDSDAVQEVVQAAASTVTAGIEAAKSTAGIASPSRVMRRVGGYWGQGLALGIEDSMRAVRRSADAVMRIAVPAAQDRGGGSQKAAQSVTNVYVNGARVNDSAAMRNVTRDFLYELKKEAVI